MNRSSSLPSLIPPLIAIGFALFVHTVGPRFGGYAERILLDCAVAIIAAVSLNIVNGFTGQFSIGHAAFMAVGGYTAAWISYYFTLAVWKVQWSPDLAPASLVGAHQWILLGAAIVGGLAAAGAGWLVGLPSLRLRGDYLAIVTLGFGEILRVLFQQTNPQVLTYEGLQTRPLVGFGVGDEAGWLLPPGVGGSLGFTDIPKVTNLFWAYLFVGAAVLFSYRLKLSSYGRAMISIREDEIAAEAMGVNVTKLKVRAFMFAAFFAGIAGALFAHQPGNTLRPLDAGFLRSFEIVIMVVLGGLGSISGAILAAIIITGVNALLLGLAEYGLLSYRMPTFALVLILLMIFRPQGLFGIREVWDFFTSRRHRRAEGFDLVLPGGAASLGQSTAAVGATAPGQQSGSPAATPVNDPAVPVMLDVQNIGISFGGLKAVQNFTMRIPRGGLYGLIGPNGAGKTTVFNLLTGVYVPQSGSIVLDGVPLIGKQPYEIAAAGLSRTFQNIRLFPDLSVLDNVRIACHLRGRHSLHATLLRDARYRRQEGEILDCSMSLLGLFNLDRLADEQARNLSYGDQRRLEIVRALATQPKLILLDEPAAGMNPAEKIELAKSIEGIRDRFKLTVLLIEHDMSLVMDVCERITVLDYGQIIAEGTPAEIQKNPKVIEAYLGEEVAD